MATQAEIEAEKRKTKIARAELRELEAQLEELEEDLVGRDPLRTGLADAAGDAGAIAQGVVHDIEIFGPVKVGHVTMGLGFLARVVRLAAKPHSGLDIATRIGDGFLKGGEAIEANRMANRRREERREEAEWNERERQGPRVVEADGERAFESRVSQPKPEDEPSDTINTTATEEKIA